MIRKKTVIKPQVQNFKFQIQRIKKSKKNGKEK